jgi:hypothetical protein
MMVESGGRIITFYSFKGGVGRTMALSNVACVLGSNGYRVLLIDAHFDAPGLHRYLRPFLTDRELSTTPGLIEFFGDSEHRDARSASLDNYVIGLNANFGGSGSLSFLPAGRQDVDYAQRVKRFSWDDFSERGGEEMIAATRERLRQQYDYVLVDSAPGLGWVPDICTAQLPDALAVFFSLNRQSIRGAAAVAAAAQARSGEALPIYPVPTRSDDAEVEKRAAAIRYARRMFASCLTHVQQDRGEVVLEQQAAYWRDVETPYVPFYAYEEVLASFCDEPGSRRGVLAPNERLAQWLTGNPALGMRPQSEESRGRVVAAAAFSSDEPLAQPTLPGRKNPFRKLADLVRSYLTHRRNWRYATAALTMLCIVMAVALWIVVTQSEALRSALSDSDTRFEQAQEDRTALAEQLEEARKQIELLRLPRQR